MSQQKIPEKIGKYRVIRKLGDGAMGIVYEAMDEAIERRVAVKILHTHLLSKADGQQFLDRFKREAKSAARCIHNNIVLVLEYGEDQGVPFIAMEYVDGPTLQDLIQSGKKISLKKILSFVSQLLKAIHAAHSLGVIHRDIKAANIILCKQNKGIIKLADFGIARITENNSMTLTGAVIGTPKYMAPEQMFGLKVDQRADLFSIALVFTELLGILSPRTRVKKSKLPPLDLPQNNTINYSVLYPEALIPVLQKGLASKADDRFQSAREFAAAIQAAIPELRKAPVDSISQEKTLISGQDASDEPQIMSNMLDRLTDLLRHYIGPVAKNVLREHCRHLTSIDDLVSAAAREIPENSQRKDFLKKWQTQTLASASPFSSSAGFRSTVASRTSSVDLDENTIQQISKDYTEFVGPFAARLVEHYCMEASDKDQFLHKLADEIPDQNERDIFLRRWALA